MKPVIAEMDGLLSAPMRLRKAQKSLQDAEKGVEKADEHNKDSLRFKESAHAALAAAQRDASVDCEEDGEMEVEERDPDEEIQQVSPHASRTHDRLDVHSKSDAQSSQLDLLCSSLLSQSHAMPG